MMVYYLRIRCLFRL